MANGDMLLKYIGLLLPLENSWGESVTTIFFIGDDSLFSGNGFVDSFGNGANDSFKYENFWLVMNWALAYLLCCFVCVGCGWIYGAYHTW